MRCLPRRSELETLLARAASQTKAKALILSDRGVGLKAYKARECPDNRLRLAGLKKGDYSPKRKDTPAHILRGCGHRKCRHTMAKGAPEGAKGVAEDAATTVLRLHVRASFGIGQASLGRLFACALCWVAASYPQAGLRIKRRINKRIKG